MGTIANWFGYVLNFIYNLVQNYGLAIILFSVLLKLIMLPFSIKQQKSMKKTAKIQEETKKLEVKYNGDREKISQATMELYKREHFSPFSGCLSTIITFIVFISVFYLVSRPLTYMKKVDSNLIQQYENEISESGEKSSYPEIKVIEEKSSQDEKIYINMNFLGLDLSKVPMQNWTDFTAYIIPILYVITTFANMKITEILNKSKKQREKEKADKLAKKEQVLELKDSENKETVKEESLEDQMQSMQQMTKSMTYMMPIMSIGIAIIAPLGLSLYWLVSNLLQLLERVVMEFISNKRDNKKEA